MLCFIVQTASVSIMCLWVARGAEYFHGIFMSVGLLIARPHAYHAFPPPKAIVDEALMLASY